MTTRRCLPGRPWWGLLSSTRAAAQTTFCLDCSLQSGLLRSENKTTQTTAETEKFFKVFSAEFHHIILVTDPSVQQSTYLVTHGPWPIGSREAMVTACQPMQVGPWNAGPEVVNHAGYTPVFSICYMSQPIPNVPTCQLSSFTPGFVQQTVRTRSSDALRPGIMVCTVSTSRQLRSGTRCRLISKTLRSVTISSCRLLCLDSLSKATHWRCIQEHSFSGAKQTLHLTLLWLDYHIIF